MDPQISTPNWSLFHNKESSIATESLVFVTGFYRNMQFSITTGSMSFLFDSVATYFNNVAIEF